MKALIEKLNIKIIDRLMTDLNSDTEIIHIESIESNESNTDNIAAT